MATMYMLLVRATVWCWEGSKFLISAPLSPIQMAMDDIALEGLSDKRKHVIASGVAITMAIFDGLKIETMRTSKGALREGNT